MYPLSARFGFADLPTVGSRVAYRLRIGRPAEHRDLTFADLHRLVCARASGFMQMGCSPGERVALLMPHSEGLITAFFGALYAGLVPSIVAWPTAKMDSEKYRRNLAAVVASLDAPWLMTDHATAQTLSGSVGRATVISPDMAGTEPAIPPQLTTSGPAFIQFSGGTTGTQKSVPVSYATLGRQLAAYGSVLQLTDDDHVISWLPLYHDMGLVACLLLPFVYRLPVTIFAPMEWVMDPTPFLEEVGRCRATLCWMPNFALSFMASRVRAGVKFDLSSLRAVINCSEPVRAESMEDFGTRFANYGLPATALHACYAMAETTFAVTQTTVADPPRYNYDVTDAGRPRVSVSSGRPIPGMGMMVADEAGVPVPDGHTGELWLRGTSLMTDYLDTTTRSAFTDEWYRTGDLGTIIDEHVYVTGRKKDLVIVGGVNVYPEDLEAAVGQVAGIHAGRVVAMGLEDRERGTEKLVVVAEADSLDELDQAPTLQADMLLAIITACGIAPYRVFVVPPRWIVKSTAGKISRAETKAKVMTQWEVLHDSGRAV